MALPFIAVGAVGALAFYAMGSAKQSPIPSRGEATDNRYAVATASSASRGRAPLPATNEMAIDYEAHPNFVSPLRERIFPSQEVVARMERTPLRTPSNFGSHAALREQVSRLWTSGRFHGRYAPAVSGLQ